jgi:predicted ATPase with chaperone activity
MMEFSKTLKGLYGEKSSKKSGAEEEARRDFLEAIEKLRKQRRLYRKMKADALMERQNLLNSMALQNEDEELLRQKVREENLPMCLYLIVRSWSYHRVCFCCPFFFPSPFRV